MNLIALLEALYRVEQTRVAWLDGVVQTAHDVVEPSAGVGGVLYNLSSQRNTRAELIAGCKLSEDWIEVGERQHADPMFAPLHAAVYGGVALGSTAELAAMGASDAIAAKRRMLSDMAQHGIGEVVVANGAGQDRCGCALLFFSQLGTFVPAAVREQMALATLHLAAAQRLNRRLGQGEVLAPEAVLRPDGEVEHVESSAKSSALREQLTAAARLRAWVTGPRGRDEPRKALELWKMLASGRWTLVDHFESDGKRYLLACQNVDVSSEAPRLSVREQQVLSLVRRGHTNKSIAYELGLAHATVRVLVARVAKKLGVSTRAQLVQTPLSD